MGSKKEWFINRLMQNISDVIDLTYRVSYAYASDNPQLSLEYDAKHHTLVVCMGEYEWVISIKQNRLNKTSVLSTFDEVKQAIHQTYPALCDNTVDMDLIERTQVVCLKHIDLNQESPLLNAFFRLQASDGVLTSTMRDRERYIWRGVAKHYGTDVDYITVVDAHPNGQTHSREDISPQYVKGYIYGQLSRLNNVLDINRKTVRNNFTAQSDVPLADSMKG